MLSIRIFLTSALVLAAIAFAGNVAQADTSLEERQNWRVHRYNANGYRSSRNGGRWRKHRKHKAKIVNSPLPDAEEPQCGDEEPEADSAPSVATSKLVVSSPPVRAVRPATTASPRTTTRTRTRGPVALSTTNTPPPPAATTPANQSSGDSGLPANMAAVLKAHNDYRAKHDAPAMTWDPKLAAAAQQWTDRCIYEHGGGKSTGSGENIAAGYSDLVGAFNAWGPGEEADYDPNNPQYSHFTQIVWKASTKLGCGITNCSNLKNFGKGNFISCIYNPAGNMYGSGANRNKYFDENVTK